MTTPNTPASPDSVERDEFQIEFNKLGYQWSESNQEKAFLGWRLAKSAALLSSDAKPDEQLCKFYGVTNYPDLVKAQAHHIEKLQSKIPPLRDDQPGKVRFA